MKNQAQNTVEKPVPDPIIKKNQTFSNSLKHYKVFILRPSRSLPKCIKTKVLTICLYFLLKLF